MDLERIRDFNQQRRVLEHKINTAEPKNPAENLTPSERFSSLVNRIETLPIEEESFADALFKKSKWSFEGGITLNLYTVYEPGFRITPRLFQIGAEWHTVEKGKKKLIKVEQLWLEDVNKPESITELGLLEESVAEAERAHSEQAARMAQQIPPSWSHQR